MERQKKVALINDVTGFGRCSIAVELPIISSLGIQGCMLPTAILSAHTGYSTYFFDDYTKNMRAYIENWKELELSFDGICTGFLGSKEQIELVLSFLTEFKKDNTLVVVDPVMGDDGVLYATYTEEMCEEMKRLIHHADIITPNVTEAYRLLDRTYPSYSITETELEQIAKELCEKGPQKVVITGIEKETEVLNYCYEKNGSHSLIRREKIASSRPGTGDIFTSVVTGAEMYDIPLEKAVLLAADFVKEGLIKTIEQKIPHNDGICFEPLLGSLIQRFEKLKRENKK